MLFQPEWRNKRISAEQQRLRRETETLFAKLAHTRDALRAKERYAGKLETLLHERLRRIDALNSTVVQLREQNRRLDEEAERLAGMVRLSL